MNEILNFLNNNNKYTDIHCLKTYLLPEGKEEITHIFAREDKCLICITIPHDAPNENFLLRISSIFTPDKWDNPIYETLIDGWQNVLRELEYEGYQYDIGYEIN